jgi:hypothetical protein
MTYSRDFPTASNPPMTPPTRMMMNRTIEMATIKAHTGSLPPQTLVLRFSLHDLSLHAFSSFIEYRDERELLLRVSRLGECEGMARDVVTCGNETGASGIAIGETSSSCDWGTARLRVEGPSTGDTGDMGTAATYGAFTVLSSGYFEYGGRSSVCPSGPTMP